MTHRSSYKALVCFDLDDTLYREYDYIMSGVRHAARSLFDLDTAAQLEHYIEGRFAAGQRDNLITDALRAIGEERRVALFIDAYRAHPPNLQLHAAIARMLTHICSIATVSVGVITDGVAERQRRKVEALGLTRWIQHIVYTDELQRPKPAPEAYRHMLRRAGNPLRSIYVADNSRKDFVAPSDLGWECIQVIYANRVHSSDCLTGIPRVYSERELCDLMCAYDFTSGDAE